MLMLATLRSCSDHFDLLLATSPAVTTDSRCWQGLISLVYVTLCFVRQ